MEEAVKRIKALAQPAILVLPAACLAKRPDLSNSVNCCGFGFDYLCTVNIDVAIGWLQARGILRGAGAMVLIA